MADLIAPKAPLQVRFLISQPLNLLLTMALIPAVDQFEGLDEWLREARSSLPADRRKQIALLTGFAGRRLRVIEAVAARFLRSDAQAQVSFAAFYDQLAELTPAEFQEIALQALRKGAPEGAVDPATLLPEQRQVEAYLASRSLRVDGSEAAALVIDREGLKHHFMGTLTRFWEDLYQPVYEACLPMMERSVVYHRRQAYPPQFDELFLAVTGRILPAEVQLYLEEIHQVRFIPSCHLGPYVAFIRNDDLLTIFYNCRSSLLEERQAGEQVRHLYPLLKALADETRLQILLLLREGEMYALEIAERLGLSQPAVSRHLKLMVTAGLLQVRPEGGAKYYLPDRDVLRRLADELRSLFR